MLDFGPFVIMDTSRGFDNSTNHSVFTSDFAIVGQCLCPGERGTEFAQVFDFVVYFTNVPFHKIKHRITRCFSFFLEIKYAFNFLKSEIQLTCLVDEIEYLQIVLAIGAIS